MEIKQIYELVNSVTEEVTGQKDLVTEDLSNLVDVGDTLENANALDNYVKALTNRIGRMIFVNRVYEGGAPKVLMEAWEYGSIVEKVSGALPEAEENETWELNDGASYDQNIFTQPKVIVKFFNKGVAWEIPMSYTDKQVKESFTGPVEMNAFLSMLYNDVDKSLTVKLESLILRTINNMIGETLHAEYPTGGDTYKASSGVRAINLLKLYNDSKGATLTKEKAILDLDFLKFATYQILLTQRHMSKMSTIFNMGAQPRFTPNRLSHVVLLDDFASASDVYLQSDTFHKELVKLPNYETISYWQGSGTKFALGDVSKINIKTSQGNSVTLDYIIGVIYDRDSLGVMQPEKYATTHRNEKAEFTNVWYKAKTRYFNDFNENFVVFFLA